MTAPTVAQPDVVDAGRVLATLDDWRAITFVLMFLVVTLVVERLWVGWMMRKERERMWEIAERMGTNADKIADAMNGLRTEIVVLRAVSARMESQGPDGGERGA